MSERSSRHVKDESPRAGGRSALAGEDKPASADHSAVETEEAAADFPRIVQLEQELEATKVELQDAIADITEYKQAAATANHDLQQPLEALVLLQGQLATAVQHDRSQEQAAKVHETPQKAPDAADSLPDEDRIDIPRTCVQEIAKPEPGIGDAIADSAHRTGAILVIEDDCNLRELLKLLLRDEGHHAVASPDGSVALELVARGTIRPDLILADYNLPNGTDALQMIAKVREELQRSIPAIVLTGDVPAKTLALIASQDCVQIGKPVKLKELALAIQRLLPPSRSVEPAPNPSPAASSRQAPIIYIVDDEDDVREALRSVLEESGRTVATFSNCDAFLQSYHPGRAACLLIDANLPGMNGLELLRHLDEAGHTLPAIMINSDCDVQMVVQAMKAGVLDFIEKPIGRSELLASVELALEQSQDLGKLSASRAFAADRVAGLTPRQHQIMDLILAGELTKNIAVDLGISQRTVESHRASIMKRTGSKSLPALARLALLAARSGAPPAQRKFSLKAGQRKTGT